MTNCIDTIDRPYGIGPVERAGSTIGRVIDLGPREAPCIRGSDQQAAIYQSLNGSIEKVVHAAFSDHAADFREDHRVYLA